MLELADSAVLVHATAPDWQSAVLLAGAALEASGAVTAEYGPRMVAMVEQFGAYIKSDVSKWSKLIRDANLTLK